MWSSQEAAQYIRTLKAYENKGKNNLTGLSKATTVREQAVEALSSVRTIQKRDADRLLDRYGSIEDIITEPDYRAFEQLNNLSRTKTTVLTQTFKGPLLTN